MVLWVDNQAVVRSGKTLEEIDKWNATLVSDYELWMLIQIVMLETTVGIQWKSLTPT